MSHTLIAPSVLAADFANLQRDIEMINNSDADWFHIDIMDGVFVPNISFGIPVLQAINKHAKKHGRIIHCLLQLKIAQEATKFGMSSEAAHTLLESDDFKRLENVAIVGVMGMASFTDNTAQIKEEFETLKSTFKSLKNINPKLTEISMGMSGDYPLAIDCGSTMVRIGSSIFGARNYSI